ncbi:MAG: YncE family protein [Gemmatimonadota bacterium]
MTRLAPVAAALAFGVTCAAAQAPPSYRVGVVSESGDMVTWLRPESGGRLALDHVVKIDPRPPEIDGPHNITTAPDQQSYYVSVSHGTPYGALWRLDVKTDTLLGIAPLEMYPTTIALTPDGEFAFVANSDFYGDRPHVNPVSIVHTPTMTTITNLPACDMPHGAKVNHSGRVVYIACMHSDELLEIDLSTLAIAHRTSLGTGQPMAGMSHGASAGAGLDGECSATFVAVSPDDKRLYVACNHGTGMQVWDATTRQLITTVATGAGAYNVEPSPDGKWVIVTNKKDQSVSVIDAATLVEVKRIPTSKKIVHGVAFAPDGRYAYISQESIGADPGAVDVLDLESLRIVSSFPVAAQPTGITILRSR